MRKIEQNLIAAIRANREWSESNTPFAGGLVLLHGHVIARKDGNMWQINLQGYNTQTTRSRLTAILGEFSVDAYAVATKSGMARIMYRSGSIADIDSEGWYNVR